MIKQYIRFENIFAKADKNSLYCVRENLQSVYIVGIKVWTKWQSSIVNDLFKSCNRFSKEKSPKGN